MKRWSSLILLVVLYSAAPSSIAAQSEDDAMREGVLAFREGDYETAERELERITSDDPTQADAFFLLARLYTETPLENRSKANRALDRALAIEPDNVTYLVGRLQHLRKESWNFISEKIREQKRIDLAHRILELDSTNSFGHEELGAAYIRDFWRYRNAVMLPTLRFGGSILEIHGSAPDAVGETAVGSGSRSGQSDGASATAGTIAADAINSQIFDPNSVFLADRFDLDALERVGVPFQDLSSRAQRAYDSAIGHLKNSLASDPRRRSVYDRMMEIYALKGEYPEALSMLEDMYTFYADDPHTWLYLGLAQYKTGNMDAAARSFETALEYLNNQDRDAFQSLDYLLSSDEKQAYQEDSVAYASRFWTSKDPRYLTPFNERKLEHYSRLVYADLLYGSEDLGLRGWNTERGRILVRYGLPFRDVVIVPQSTSRVNMGSAFSAEENDALSTSSISIDERMGGTPREHSSFDMLEEANTFNIWEYGDFRFVFEDPFRNGEYRLYSPSASEISSGSHPWLNDYDLRARELSERMPDRYEFEAPGRQIELPFLVSAFKGDENDADIYVSYGIPIADDGLDQETIGITANVGAFLISQERDILVERRRTIYGLRGLNVRTFEEANLWVDTQPMTSPPGTHQLSMEFETASGETVAIQRRDVVIPDFRDGAFNVSDIMLAYHVEESGGDAAPTAGDVLRRGVSITPAPWSVFSTEQPIYLYFEIYNLDMSDQGRTDYEMEAVLMPRDPSKGLKRIVNKIIGGREGVSVSLPGSGSTTNDGHYLILDAANQDTGLYTLTLRVTDNVTGKAVERAQDLFLE